MAGGTCTSCKQIFPPESQSYLESPFEFVSIAESDFSYNQEFLLARGDSACGSFVATFTGDSLADTPLEMKAAAISWDAAGSAQV